jgi:hypothetical protein
MRNHLEEENMVSKTVNNLDWYNEVVEMRSMLKECPHRMKVQDSVNKAFYVRLVKEHYELKASFAQVSHEFSEFKEFFCKYNAVVMDSLNTYTGEFREMRSELENLVIASKYKKQEQEEKASRKEEVEDAQLEDAEDETQIEVVLDVAQFENMESNGQFEDVEEDGEIMHDMSSMKQGNLLCLRNLRASSLASKQGPGRE